MIATGAFFLLAERNNLFRDMGSGFREKKEHFDATDLFFWFLLIIGIFVVIGLLARILGRNDKHRLFNSPRALFRALCRAHGLDSRSRRLLRQIARAQQLNPPARVFLEPACFEPARLGPEFAGRQAAVAALATKLFAYAESGPGQSGAAAASPR